MKIRIAIIGGGPVGPEAAVSARSRGINAEVFERGAAGECVRQWGHVRMFSPFGMNSSEVGRQAARQEGGPSMDGDAFLTGLDYANQYLSPLAASLGPAFHARNEVVSIGRPSLLKGEWIGQERRKKHPFRLLLRQEGRERLHEADVVLDCSGTFGNWNPLGEGGNRALGEGDAAKNIVFGIPDLLGEWRYRAEGKRILVVGGGHSAATVIRDLGILQEADGGTEIVWAVRDDRAVPCREIPEDPLPERTALAHAVNRLVSSGERIIYHRNVAVHSILERQGERMTVQFSNGLEESGIDLIIGATGCRPDLELARELQVKLCYATEGTFNLAAALLGEAGGDCLKIGNFGVETLQHPEPRYFALGMKSYGRHPDFLIRTGIEQAAAVLDWLEATS